MAPKLTPEATSLGEVPEEVERPTSTEGKLKKPPSLDKNRKGTSTPGSKERVNVWKRDTPKKGRKCLSVDYEKEVSGREQWWRKDIRITPVPGSYETETFLKEFEVRPATYAFKNEGRKKDADVIRKGAYLLPGAYEKHDLIFDLSKTRNTYTFKNSKRSKDLPIVKDKDINVCPTAYEMDSYLSVSVRDGKNKHANFKSASMRFPTIYFKGTKNPAPCHYEYRSPPVLHTVTSSFKSRTPRFSSSHTKVPGPGTYDSTYQSPMPATIAKMGRNHGLFFTSAFQC
ncbi:Protein STPG4 [Holothuria leucospilota]|uniref:Protein STPG4 n=1 Tax=Holothuria leucospilota TaxID=206669 RepID=A0A9Q1CGB5_HOLLE|nr:Protein STPG4 [Holothuria leucospilota]